MTRLALSAVRGAGISETVAVLVIAAAFVIPWISQSPMVYSLANQMLIAITAAFSVYIMLRMNLMTFAVPTFMAIGGYTAASLGLRYGVTDVLLLGLFSFVVPALFALPLGALVLRLTGVYFVLVTVILTEITQLALFESALGSRLPESLQALLEEPPPELGAVFPRARWVLPEKMRRIRRELGRDDWVPFLVDAQPCHEDYYCLDLSSPGPSVLVFAVHAKVAEWPTLGAWLEWVRHSDRT